MSVKYDSWDLLSCLFDGIPYSKLKSYDVSEGSKFSLPWKFKENKLIIDVPGFSKHDIDVSVERSEICVKIKLAEKESSSFKFYFDSDNFIVDNAECRNGQLIIELKEKEKNVKMIEIK